MTATELNAISFWRASRALRQPSLAPADRAMIADQLYDLATQANGRVREMAARVVWPDVRAEDGAA